MPLEPAADRILWHCPTATGPAAPGRGGFLKWVFSLMRQLDLGVDDGSAMPMNLERSTEGRQPMRRLVYLAPLVASAALMMSATATAATSAAAGTLPSGETTFGQTTIEPAYNDATGTIVYLSTPRNATTNPNSHDTAPIYLPVYPSGSTVGTLNCEDLPVDNCPDHGPLVASIAQSYASANGFGSVYADGVLGHDHLIGLPPSGDFNIDWEPVLVLFMSIAAADEHPTTLGQIEALESAHEVALLPLPPATFHCSVVPAAVYGRGTPVSS
jgi:hypothetical protein